MTGFSNQWGTQVFYVDGSQHVNRINVKALTYDTLAVGGSLTMPTNNGGCPSGASLSGISSDDHGGQDVFYIGTDQHVWELHSNDGVTWAAHDLTQTYGGPATFPSVACH